jgi:hypothetical protein
VFCKANERRGMAYLPGIKIGLITVGDEKTG